MRIARLMCLPFALAAAPAAAQDSIADGLWQYRVSTGVDYSAGRYGAVATTDIAFMPFTVQAARGPWTLKASSAWVSVDGPARLLDGATEGTTGLSRRSSGWGDTNLSVGYSLESLYDLGLFIDFTARVKAPTASFAKGLGTGKIDYAVQTDVAYVLGDLMPFATLGYKFNGEPAGFNLRDVPFGSFGVQYTVSEILSTGVVVDMRGASLSTAADPSEGTAYFNVRITDGWSMNVYAVAGFSRNSPSAGGGATFTYRWF